MEVSLVAEALKFMVLGMSVVFLFLVILVYVVEFQAKLIAKYFPEDTSKKQTPIGTTTSKSTTDKKKIVAAITAAIAHHNSLKS